MKTAQRPCLRRVAQIDQMIRAGRCLTSESAAHQLEVDGRTIKRDIEFMRDSLHAPIAFSPAHNGYYYTEPTYALPLLKITEGELIALFCAERVLQTYQGAPFAADLKAALEKITASLPDKVTLDLRHLDEVYSVRQTTNPIGDVAQFRHLLHAVLDGRQLELEYWSAHSDKTTRRIVDPYQLASLQGEWYVLGYCHLREDIRTFAPGRIRSLRETGERFDRPPDFRINDYLDAGLGKMHGKGPPQTVQLRFTPAAAKYIRERQWHPTQKLKDQQDGSLTLTMRVNQLLEVKRWVMSWGSNCAVVEPAELKTEIIEDMQRMLHDYGSSSHEP